MSLKARYLLNCVHSSTIPVFPTHSFICGGPPQYQYCPPQIFCFLFSHPVQSLRQRSSELNLVKYANTVDGNVAFSLSVKPMKKRSFSKQDLCIEMLVAELKRVGIKDEVNVHVCVLTVSWLQQLNTSEAVNQLHS